jgi:hypothetical protein
MGYMMLGSYATLPPLYREIFTKKVLNFKAEEPGYLYHKYPAVSFK